MPNPDLKTVRIALPEAAPQLYLAWMAFTVTFEQRLRDHPTILGKAARAGFVTTPPAQIAHRAVMGPLTEQSEAALREGNALFVPVLEGTVPDLATAVDYLQRWGEWLGTTDALGPAAISVPAPRGGRDPDRRPEGDPRGRPLRELRAPAHCSHAARTARYPACRTTLPPSGGADQLNPEASGTPGCTDLSFRLVAGRDRLHVGRARGTLERVAPRS